MLHITIPANNIPERKYIIQTIFSDFLGLDYTIHTGGSDYLFLLDSGNKLTIKDFFWNKNPEIHVYLNERNIPKRIIIRTKNINRLLPEDNLPLIYGDPEQKIIINSKNIICFDDIFASAFFMLTRWEEYVLSKRDQHDRFLASASLSGKFGFLNRPVVNEYVEYLWNMLCYLGFNESRKKMKFDYTLSHDVDILRFYPSRINMVKEILGDLLKRNSLSEAERNFKRYIRPFFSLQKDIKDPANTFQWLIEQNNDRDHPDFFYFMAANSTLHDNGYSIHNKKMKKILNQLINCNQLIGFHPSYESFNNPVLFRHEKEKLESIIGFRVYEGRQHYLRFKIPETWQIWEDAHMLVDSSLSYAESPGFRCGVCWEFPVFNILSRKKLKLRERPLIVMECSLMDYQKMIDLDEIIENFMVYINKCFKYNGNFVMLWHNSYLDTKEKKEIYRFIVQTLFRLKKEQ